MPDPKRLPAEYQVGQSVLDKYVELPVKFRGYFERFGKDADAKADPPTPPDVPQVVGEELAKIPTYATKAQGMRNAYRALVNSTTQLAPLTRESVAKAEEGKGAINYVIEQMNAEAPKYPPDGTTKTEQVLTYMTAAVDSGAKAMTTAISGQEKVGGEVSKTTEELKAELAKARKEIEELKERLKTPGPPGSPPGGNNLNPPPGPDLGGNNKFPPLGTNELPGLDDLFPKDPKTPTPTPDPKLPGDPSDPTTPPKDPITPPDNIGQPPSSPNTPSPQPVSPINSGLGGMSGMGGMGGMSPWDMMNMRNIMDPDMNRRRNELDPDRGEREPVVAAPAPITPAAAQGNQPAPVAAAQPAAVTAPPAPPGQPQTQPVAGPPQRTPDADGSVLYTFPDNRTQRVSQIVAQALDAAFFDGADAKTAYEKTSAHWADNSHIGEPVDPNKLITGDVATWEKDRTAIAVVFGSGETGTVEVVVKADKKPSANNEEKTEKKEETVLNGVLKPFANEMSDSTGSFGAFAGFKHPAGIELAQAKDATADPTAPTDQSAPVLAAPA
ncbi:hypothetical protein [Nocardia sp. NPDC050710]|uniref:hypothetical protein n=1 Tax=Nocardia sp. NPDC050710 TaxID=3157220 RepID=UPI0034098A10